MFQITDEASNRSDWTVQISATDLETGEAIDFSVATAITVAVKDESGCQMLLATLLNGKVTLPDVGSVQFAFTEADMAQLCPATYQIGSTYTTPDGTYQLFVGSVSVYDGVVSR
jgi:hypothetical protein